MTNPFYEELPALLALTQQTGRLEERRVVIAWMVNHLDAPMARLLDVLEARTKAEPRGAP